jgi:hypothetical protein
MLRDLYTRGLGDVASCAVQVAVSEARDGQFSNKAQTPSRSVTGRRAHDDCGQGMYLLYEANGEEGGGT